MPAWTCLRPSLSRCSHYQCPPNLWKTFPRRNLWMNLYLGCVCSSARAEGPMRTRLSINDLYRLMQLSKKYMADGLQSEVSEHLCILYPSDWFDYNSDRRKAPIPTDRRFNHYDAINLAERFELLNILPCALYLASRRGLEQVLDTPKVAREVVRSIHVFRTEVDTFISNLIIEGNRFEPEDCLDVDGCNGPTFAIMQRIARACRTLSFDVFEDGDLFDNADVQPSPYHLCGACRKDLNSQHRTLQALMWGRLPDFCSSGWWSWQDIPKAHAAIDQS
ncbi:unnamed protein product [Peniophora sp. CBMAI 1063]|nr:unnamed protein product [Peniophora sp. CBMAI 1063]